MDDARLVGVLEGLANLQGDPDGLFERDLLSLHPVFERLPLDVFHGDEELAGVVPCLVDLADEGVIQGCGGLGLPQKALFHPRIALELVGEEFQGDFTFEDAIAGQVDLAHAPLPEELDEFVMLDFFAGVQHSRASGTRFNRRSPRMIITFSAPKRP